ncbi:MAG TPA: glycoside hydrolase family 2 TIM barrel-domain containing protein, partial [Acidimicrobiales bacterium]|nr:glycoside hydrolase family 2 TIM barrel-domain containing protein [Acidimicrobiales bacterium]
MQDTWDKPHYTNVQMPWPNRPPYAPADSPTGVYERTFSVPGAWADKRVVLHVGAAESVLIVALNGEEVGVGKDSHLAQEYDLTDLLAAGENTLRLTVVKWSDASFIEDQDQWWHGGITRPVYLYATGATYLADVQIDAGLEPDNATGTLALEVHVGWREGYRAPGWRVEARLEGFDGVLRADVAAEPPPPGGPGDFVIPGPPRRGRLDLDSLAAANALSDPDDLAMWERARPVVIPPRVGVATLRARIPGVTPWSAEVPALRTLQVALVAPDGSVAERVERRIGFRRVEVTAKELLVNGRAVLIRGVNRHDFNPHTGRVVSPEDLRADVVLMKRFNVNALRTSHYPNDPMLLDLCDELGLYVVDEADIESHAFYEDVCEDPRYRSQFVDRVARMAVRDRHHPSVVLWSLGNESGYGANHDAAAGWLRRFDPSRPLHYEGAMKFDWASPQTASDLTCPMYPPIAAIVAHATSPDQRHPLIMCEFSHAMGNSNGTLGEYWDAIESTHGLQGGFLWEWRDHGLDLRLPDGRTRHAYGGDFGDLPNDGTFVCDGITFPDRAPKPGLWEHKHLAAPVRVVSGADEARGGRVVLENRGDFRDLAWLRASWAVTDDGDEVARGELPLPDVAPGARAVVSLPGFSLPPADGRERVLTVRFTLAEATPWAPAGHEAGWAQVIVEPAAERTAPPTTGDVPLDGDGNLVHPAFAARPALALWRAPTDNDRIGGMGARWTGWGLPTLTRTLDRIERGADQTVVHATWRTAAGIEVPHVVRLGRTPDGAIRVTETVDIPAVLDDLPRVGTLLTLVPGHEAFTWYGTGPHETYPDRARGGQMGRFASTV